MPRRYAQRCLSRAGAIAAIGSWLIAAAPLHAQATCLTRVTSADRSALWAAPLDRLVSVRLTDVSVRDALDRLAALARLDLSYSAELLPGGSRVCLSLERAPVGAIIDALLEGASMRAIVLGTSQVVLAPTRPLPAPAESATPMRRASVLDRVVVTGSPDGAPHRAAPYALDVIDGQTLAQHHVATLGEALDLAVPGLWTWAASAGTVTARFGSIRGTSSFGASAPKIYLDGIEVANPLLVTQLDPSRVARIEVIRGPQGAALYGAEAISGVVNILTRHDGTPTGGVQVQLSSAAGVARTDFAARDPFVQDHALSLRRGTTARSVGLGLNVSTSGAYVPGADERRLLADLDGRVAKGNAIYTGTARLSLQRANATTGLAFGASRVGDTTFAGDSAGGQDVAQYTVGGSIALQPSLHWTHTVIAGADGFRLQGLSGVTAAAPLQYTAAASVSGAEVAADRLSVRMRSVGRYDVAPSTLLTLTLAAEQAFTHELATTGSGTWPLLGSGMPAPGIGVLLRPTVVSPGTRWYANGGLSAQGQIAWRDRWYGSVGVRAERITGATPNAQQSLLPMIGAAYVRDIGATVLKVRGAYGKGIRPARTPLSASSWLGRTALSTLATLQPESQSGVEFGADLLLGAHASVHVTRFDQRAAGLVQPVATLALSPGRGGRVQRTMSYTLQNIGAITNRGWEVEAQSRWGALALNGTLSLVDSRVDQVAQGYRGELRPGDRMLDVPATTLSVSAAYTAGRWTITNTATTAADWIGYDRAAIGDALEQVGTNEAPRDLTGGAMRRFWTDYDGLTRWRGSLAYRVRGDLSVVFVGDNLLDVQRGAPDNATVIMGRTLTLGVRTQF